MTPLRAELGDVVAPDAGYLRALRRQRRQRQTRLQTTAWLTLALSGWTATTLLVTVGLFGLAFFLLGNASLVGAMKQLQLFASHYFSAAPTVRADFDVWLAKVAVLLVAGVGFFRRGSLLTIIREARGA